MCAICEYDHGSTRINRDIPELLRLQGHWTYPWKRDLARSVTYVFHNFETCFSFLWLAEKKRVRVDNYNIYFYLSHHVLPHLSSTVETVPTIKKQPSCATCQGTDHSRRSLHLCIGTKTAARSSKIWGSKVNILCIIIHKKIQHHFLLTNVPN